jgi:hypothetical protein
MTDTERRHPALFGFENSIARACCPAHRSNECGHPPLLSAIAPSEGHAWVANQLPDSGPDVYALQAEIIRTVVAKAPSVGGEVTACRNRASRYRTAGNYPIKPHRVTLMSMPIVIVP